MKNKIFTAFYLCPLLSLSLACGAVLRAQTLNVTDQAANSQKERSKASVPNDFVLTDENGQRFHLFQLRGKVVLLFFGYTYCPEACPTTMAKLAHVSKQLGKEAAGVVTLFVSVDPGRDTPDVLKSFLAYFHMNAIGLTGSKKEIDTVVEQYGAKYEIEASDSAAGYHVNHSTDLYLLNQNGDLSGTFSYSDSTEMIVHGIKKVLDTPIFVSGTI